MPAEGSGATLPAHGRREGRAAGDQGGIGFGRRRRAAPVARTPSCRSNRDARCDALVLCRRRRRGCCWSHRRGRRRPAARRAADNADGSGVQSHLFARWRTGAFVVERRRKQDNWDIYVTLVGSSDVRRLTIDPCAETSVRRGRPTAGRSRSCGSDPTAPPFSSCRRSAVQIGS